jgi:hypothetical protein
MTVNGLVLLLNIVSAATALGAAYFWFLSVRGRLPPMLPYWDKTPPDDPFYVAFVRGVKMSRKAAISAGVSAITLAASLAFQVGASPENPLVNLHVDWMGLGTWALVLVAVVALYLTMEQIKEAQTISRSERTDLRLHEAFGDIQKLVDFFDEAADPRISREALKELFKDLHPGTNAAAPPDHYGSWKPDPLAMREIKTSFRGNLGDVAAKAQLTTEVVKLADFYERIFILMDKRVIDPDIFLSTNQDYNIVASYYVLEHVLWILAAESYEWDDFRDLALLAQGRYKKRPRANSVLSNAKFEKIP